MTTSTSSRGRLERTRWPDDLANETWTFGVERGYLRELIAYWHDAYDWREHEAAMNTFSSPLRTPGIGYVETADLWLRLHCLAPLAH